MSITVKFFASLRESLGRAECELAPETVTTAAEAWTAATDGQDRPANTLIAINMEYAKAEQAVKDGDEVAFFPPVTGG